ITFIVGVLRYWALLALCLLIGEIPLPEVRAPLPRGDFPLRLPPFGDVGVMPRQEHLGNVEPFEPPRTGILRMLEEAVFETLLAQTLRLPQNAGHEPYTRLDGHQRGGLAPGQDRIADGDLLEPAGVDDPLVHPFEPAAEDDEARPLRPLADPLLRQRT